MAHENDDRDRWLVEQKRMMAERAHAENQDVFNRGNEYSVSAGNNTMRGFLFINGGAAVAILTFIGSILTSNPGVLSGSLPNLIDPLMWLVWGVAVATAGFGSAFFLQSRSCRCYSFDEEELRAAIR